MGALGPARGGVSFQYGGAPFLQHGGRFWRSFGQMGMRVAKTRQLNKAIKHATKTPKIPKALTKKPKIGKKAAKSKQKALTHASKGSNKKKKGLLAIEGPKNYPLVPKKNFPLVVSKGAPKASQYVTPAWVKQSSKWSKLKKAFALSPKARNKIKWALATGALGGAAGVAVDLAAYKLMGAVSKSPQNRRQYKDAVNEAGLNLANKAIKGEKITKSDIAKETVKAVAKTALKMTKGKSASEPVAFTRNKAVSLLKQARKLRDRANKAANKKYLQLYKSYKTKHRIYGPSNSSKFGMGGGGGGGGGKGKKNKKKKKKKKGKGKGKGKKKVTKKKKKKKKTMNVAMAVKQYNKSRSDLFTTSPKGKKSKK